MKLTALFMALPAALTAAGCSMIQPVERAQLVLADPSPRTEAAAPRSVAMEKLTRAALGLDAEPLILATMDEGARVMTLSRAETEGETMRWVASDGTGFHFQGVQLVATERLDQDLMSVEQATLSAALPETAFHRDYHHGTKDGMRVTRLSCELAEPVQDRIDILDMQHDTLRLDETCTGPDDAPITNAYWVGIDDGTLWRSRQWVSAETGFVELERLVR